MHRAITTGLRLRDVDVPTAQEDGFRTADDSQLLNRATELQRVLFTQDEDLLAEAKQRQTNGISFAGVIGVEDLELIAKAGTPEEMANRVEYLPL